MLLKIIVFVHRVLKDVNQTLTLKHPANSVTIWRFHEHYPYRFNRGAELRKSVNVQCGTKA